MESTEITLVNIVIEIIGGITLLFLGFIILIFIICPKYRNDKFELIFYISIGDFLATIGYMLAQKREYVEKGKYPDIESNQCQLQAFLLTAFEPCVFLFSAILSYYIKESVDNIDSGNQKITSKRRIIYCLIGFCVPFGIALFAYALNTFGFVDNFCWITRNHAYSINNGTAQTDTINNNSNAFYFQIIIYLLEYGSIGVSLFFYISIIRSFYKSTSLSKEELTSIKKTNWLNFRYPIIQLCFLIPSTIIILIGNLPVPFLHDDNKRYPSPIETEKYKHLKKMTIFFPLLMCIHGLVLSIVYIGSTDLFNKLFNKNTQSKSALFNSATTTDIERNTNTITGSLLNDKDKKKDDIDLDDIGKGYMN